MSATTTRPTRWLSAAEVAREVRAALKRAFPGVTFSVRCSNYSGGSSVSIGWTDGPTTRAVERVTGRYEGKSFDGRDDSTHYHPVTLDSGEIVETGSYIMTNRSYSQMAQARAAQRFAQAVGQPLDVVAGPNYAGTWCYRLCYIWDGHSGRFVVGGQYEGDELREADHSDIRSAIGLDELHSRLSRLGIECRPEQATN